jgi:hypothetical protein
MNSDRLYAGITFSLSFTETFEDAERAARVVSILLSSNESVRPVAYGVVDASAPIEAPSAPVEILRNSAGQGSWLAGSLVMAANQHCSYQVQWNRGGPRPTFPFIGGRLMEPAFAGSPLILNHFLRTIRDLALALSPIYGDVRSMAVENWDLPFDLAVRLPDIAAISLYGPPYVGLFGARQIESAPFEHIEKLAPDLYWLEAGNSVMQPVAETRRAAIRAHLGERAFMAGRKWRYMDGMHPEFEWPA